MLKRLSDSFRSSKQQSRRRQFPKLRFEPLEDRRLLATFTVTNTSDAAVTMAGDLPGSLRQAIFDANANPGDDTIEFDASVFTVGSASLIGLTAGELEITDTLTIADAVQNEVTIDAQGNSRVLNFTASAGDLNLEGLTITGGLTTGDNINSPDNTFSGGGIRFVSDGSLNLLDITVSENSTTGQSADGGGIDNVSGTLNLTNSTVIGNSTSGRGSVGGGVFNGSGILTLTNSSVNENSTSGTFGSGGGIFSSSGAITLTNSEVNGNGTTGVGSEGGGIRSFETRVTFINSSLSGNRTTGGGEGGGASDGGGILFSRNTLTLINSVVADNSSLGSNSQGGGIRGFSGDLEVIDSTISNNSATGNESEGGGILWIGSGGFGSYRNSVTISGSTISGNRTSGDFADGGGIGVLDATFTLTNSTVSGNAATGLNSDGGGISLERGASAVINNSTVTDNHADGLGGGAFGNSTIFDVTITNSIVAGNTAGTSATDVQLTSIPTINDSLIGNNNGTNLSAAPIGSADADGNLVGTPTSPIDPLLAPLAFNGGATQTHALLPGSPAIDAGSTTLTADQRGVVRLIDGNGGGTATADIGAVEQNVSSPIATTIVRDEGGVLERPDLLSTFSVSFDVDVSVSADDLEIRNDTLAGAAVDSSAVTVEYDAVTHTATWDFDSLILDPAFYSFELSSNIVSAADNLSLDGDLDGNPGGTLIESVYVALPGDANVDGQVDVLNDAFALVANLGTTGGAAWAQGDFNGNGVVNVLGDAFILVSRLGQSVVPTTPPIPTLFLAKSDPSIAQAASTPVTNLAPPASLMTDKDKDRQSNERSTPTEQLVLAGSEELDATFASGSLFDGDFLLG